MINNNNINTKASLKRIEQAELEALERVAKPVMAFVEPFGEKVCDGDGTNTIGGKRKRFAGEENNVGSPSVVDLVLKDEVHDLLARRSAIVEQLSDVTTKLFSKDVKVQPLNALLRNPTRSFSHSACTFLASTNVSASAGGGDKAIRLPPRRKVMWDYLLEEMEWMRVDFNEERKWKIAMGRIVSQGVRGWFERKGELRRVNGGAATATATTTSTSTATETTTPSTQSLSRGHSLGVSLMFAEVGKSDGQGALSTESQSVKALLSASRVGANTTTNSTNSTNNSSKKLLPQPSQPPPNNAPETIYKRISMIHSLHPPSSPPSAPSSLPSLLSSHPPGGCIISSPGSCSPATINPLFAFIKATKNDILLLCSATSLLKFGHVLAHNNIASKTICKDTGVEDLDEPTDEFTVYLVEFGMVLSKLFSTALSSKAGGWGSIIVDGRTYVAGVTVTNDNVTSHTGTKNQFPQLNSNAWWSQIIDFPLKEKALRILIDNSSSDGTSLENNARKAAFANLNVMRHDSSLGVGNNTSEPKSTIQNWIDWAKERSAADSTTTPSAVLNQAFAPLRIDDGDGDGGNKISGKIVLTDEMTQKQRTAYETVTNQAKIQLVQSLTMSVAASSLLQLRRACFSSELIGGGGGGGGETFKSLSESSCKLSKLYELVQSYLAPSVKKNPGLAGKKIVILSTLPETLLLIGIFLKAAQLPHTVISTSPGQNGENEADAAASWVRGQHLIGDFEKSGERSTGNHILLSSIVTISGFHGGIAPLSADVFISVDDDWSGRQHYLYENVLLNDWGCGKKNAEFVKIVARNTIEEKVFCPSDSGGGVGINRLDVKTMFKVSGKRATANHNPNSPIFCQCSAQLSPPNTKEVVIKLDSNGLIVADLTCPTLSHAFSIRRGESLESLLCVEFGGKEGTGGGGRSSFSCRGRVPRQEPTLERQTFSSGRTCRDWR